MRLALHVVILFTACAAASTTQMPPSGPVTPPEPLPPPVDPVGSPPAPYPSSPSSPSSPAPSSSLSSPSSSPSSPSSPPAPPSPSSPTTQATTTAPDPGAEADFNAARAAFDRGERDAARAALETFVGHHADHPSRAQAELMLARLSLLRGDGAAAKKLLDPLATAPAETGVATSARYYLGLAELRLGQPARARELLLPYLPRAGAPSPGDEALVELRGALAEATAGVGEASAALELWDGYFRGARDHEKAYARQRARDLAAQLAPEAAWRAYSSAPPQGLARATLGARAAGYLRGQGDATGATSIDGETASARQALGFEEPAGARVGPGDPARFGLAVPLSGKFQPVGEAAMRAAMLAGGAPMAVTGAAGGRAGLLAVRDTGLDAERAARGVSELTREEAVIGILAASEKKLAAPTLSQAAQDGIPVLALDDAAPGAQGTAFQLIHAPEARVAELARRALKLGAREFALLGPDSAAGKRQRDAFRREVTAGGGKITAEATYVAGATSFSTVVAALRKAPPQAVFVAEAAERLELIAPALAVADLWPAPWGRKPPAGEPGKPRPRNVLLLSTANDLSPRLLQNAGRYVQGALLAPGFYADSGDARARAFVDGFRAAYGQDPRATEAYAFDGVNALRAVTESGARTRGDVLRALAGGTFEGLTGDMRFGADHGRVDAPRVYVVDGEQIRLVK